MKTLTLTSILLLFLAGCAPDIAETDFFSQHPEEIDPESLWVELGTASENGLAFRVLAPEGLQVGYSTVWVEIREGETLVSAGTIDVVPMWVTSTGSVISPLANARAAKNEETDRFEANPFFLQPANEAGHWELYVDYAVSGKQGALVFTVDVAEDIWVQHVDDGSDYYMAWVLPVEPTTGVDAIQFALYHLDGTNFEPIEGAEIDLYPYMDMGAGEGHSTPYEAPTHVGGGIYTGEVNFIMSGGWDMTAYVQPGGDSGIARVDTVLFKGFIVN